MAASTYLNKNGLNYFLTKLKAKFVAKDDVITTSEIDAICVDFTLDSASMTLSEINALIGEE